MTLSLAPAGRPLQGRVTLPGDKSLAHRAALFAALTAALTAAPLRMATEAFATSAAQEAMLMITPRCARTM